MIWKSPYRNFLLLMIVLFSVVSFEGGIQGFAEFDNEKSSQITLLDTAGTHWQGWTTNSNKYTGWSKQNQAGSGEEIFSVCRMEEQNTDNWLISPMLGRGEALNFHVEVHFSMRSCSEYPEPNRLRHCKETFDLFVFQTSDSEAAVGDIIAKKERFYKLATIAPDRKWVKSKTSDLRNIMNTQLKTVPVDKARVYLAFRDTGACFTVDRIRVFYLVCPSLKRNFVHFPMTPTARKSDITTVHGECVIGASKLGNTTFKSLCKSNGEWHFVNWYFTEHCQCKPGYAPIDNTTCHPCRIGHFKSTTGNQSCQSCPKNSRVNFVGAQRCTCIGHHFRNLAKEKVSAPCTTPPSEPTNLHVLHTTFNSLTLAWDPPTRSGDRDDLMYHVICINCYKTDIKYRPAKTVATTNITIQNLNPYTSYEFHVYAQNGVSEIAGALWKNREIISHRTEKGPSNKITVIRVRRLSPSSVHVIWDKPAGIRMQGYEVKVYPRGEQNRFSIYPTDSANFKIRKLSPSIEYILQIRGKSEFGWGEFSNAVVLRSHESSSVDSDGILMNPHNALERATNIIVITCVSAIVCVGLTVLALIVISRRGFWMRYLRAKAIPEKANTTHSNPQPYCNLAMQLYQPATSVAKTYIDPFTYEDPTLAVRDFTKEIERNWIIIEEVIGEGEFGEVCRGKLRVPGSPDQIVAIKTLKSDALDKNRVDFLAEASIMGQFDHPNVIALRGVVTWSAPIWIVTEYIENGSLDRFLKGNVGKFTTFQLTQMLRGIASGMHYLSEMHFVHRDLAARNILINLKLVCKVADFGLSREIELDCSAAYTTMGGKVPVRWTAPEALMYRKYTTASDIWAFGVVVWEVLSFGERPYWNWANQRVIQQVLDIGYRLPPPFGCPECLARVMSECWRRERCQRPKFAQVVQMLDSALRSPDLIPGGGVGGVGSGSQGGAGENCGISSRGMQSNCDEEYTTITRPLIDFNNVTHSDMVTEWLSSVKLDQYAPVFLANHITNLDYVTRLGQQDLLNLGVSSSGHRKRLLASIEVIRRRLGHGKSMNSTVNGSEFHGDGNCTEKLLNQDPIS